MIVTFPAATPVTVPVEEPMVATDVLLLIHVPPPVLLVSVEVAPAHTTDDAGEIAAGAAITLTAFVTKQPPAV